MSHAQSSEVTDTLGATAMQAWRRFLRAHCAIVRELDGELRANHGLTINDFDVMIQLRNAEDKRLRMSDLAEHVVLTRSGITRLIDGLVRLGYVERVNCPTDARVSYARLTDAGSQAMETARCSHHRGVIEAFVARFSDEELNQFSELLSRLPDADLPGACGGPDSGC